MAEAEIDPRLLQVEFDNDTETRIYGTGHDELSIAISVQGTKFANANQGECTISLTNLSRTQRDYLLTEGSPFVNDNRNNKTIRVRVGRVSTGLSLLYEGGIFRTQVSQPPDQTVTIRCLTKQFEKGIITSQSFSGTVPLREIATQIATSINAGLQFEATDQMISNFSFTGSTTKLVDKLNEVNGIQAYVDTRTLIVIDKEKTLTGVFKTLTPETGLIGMPQPTEQGVKVTMLYENHIRNGALLRLTSDLYPIYSGDYKIYKLSYDLANRDTPFYLIAECQRIRKK